MISRIFSSWVWLALIISNVLFLFANMILGETEMMIVNALSAGGCWVGYRLSKREEDSSSQNRE